MSGDSELLERLTDLANRLTLGVSRDEVPRLRIAVTSGELDLLQRELARLRSLDIGEPYRTTPTVLRGVRLVEDDRLGQPPLVLLERGR